MIPRPIVPLALQGSRLLGASPGSYLKIQESCLTWIGHIQPSPLSVNYEVGLEYRLPKRPQVQVLTPALECRGRERPPHRFRDKCLCLYHYPSREWHAGMMLADTVIPWASEWLLHYELWLATGVWSGGGIHPGETEEEAVEDGDDASDHVHQ